MVRLVVTVKIDAQLQVLFVPQSLFPDPIEGDPRFDHESSKEWIRQMVGIGVKVLPLFQQASRIGHSGVVFQVNRGIGVARGFHGGQIVKFQGRDDAGKVQDARPATPGHPQVIRIFVGGVGVDNVASRRPPVEWP